MVGYGALKNGEIQNPSKMAVVGQPRRTNGAIMIPIDGDQLKSLSSHPDLIPFENLATIALRKNTRGFSEGNIYEVVTPNGGPPIFYAEENLTCCKEYCLGQNRPFKVILRDELYRPTFIIERQSDCCLWFFGTLMCGGDVTVKLAETGQKLGRICMGFNVFTQNFKVYNARDELMMKIRGPSCALCFPTCTFGCGDDAKFQVRTLDSKSMVVALIHQYFIDDDACGIELASNVTSEQKALLLGALFGIKYSFYQHWNICSCKRGFTGFQVLLILFWLVILAVPGAFMVNSINSSIIS